MYFVTADKPEWPWITPAKVNNSPQLPYDLGYDNSIFIDDDDKWYLIVKNGKPNAQLPNFMEKKVRPVESEWASFCESQLKTLSIKNTGSAVAIDIGEGGDI